MTRVKLYCLLTACLVVTVPWFFTKYQTQQILGFPPWAFYSFCMTVLYAVIVALCLHRYWSVLAENDNEEDES